MKFIILTSVQFSGIMYIHICNHYHNPPPELLSSCKIETLDPLKNKSSLPAPPAHGKHHSTFCLRF